MKLTVPEAAERIKSGDVVAFPTETVYGLGADAQNPGAVRKTFEMKGRPSDNPLIVHVSGREQAAELVTDISPAAETLIREFWPGPLTLVMKKRSHIPDAVTGGLDTVAIRMPDHPVALELIKETGPLTAPSANRSGRPSPTSPEHLIQDHGDTIHFIDGGRCSIGLESTVLDLTSPKPVILREGAVTAGLILERSGIDVDKSGESEGMQAPKSPGVKYSHYKPEASVRWLSPDETPDSRTITILHTAPHTIKGGDVIDFSGDYATLAQQLYDLFRTADLKGYSSISIEHLPDDYAHSLIPALRNRITKAIAD